MGLCLIAVSIQPGFAQVNLSTMPANESNNRFEQPDYFDIVRPALSIRGFDSNSFTDVGKYGLGLKQILQKVYVDKERIYRNVYENILEVYNTQTLKNTDVADDVQKRYNIEHNSRVLQAQIFVTLVTYILQKNGNDITALNAVTDFDLPLSYTEALTKFRNGVRNPPGGNLYLRRSFEDDGVKWAKTVGNMARVWDLYLALENAFKMFDFSEYSNENSTILFSKSERENLLKSYGYFIYQANEEATESVGSPLDNVNQDEVQAGNWPMKTHVAIGYAALGAHWVPWDISSPDYEYFLDRAVRSAGKTTDQNRRKYWNYQTTNGNRYFAEGPFYMHWSLREVIPFFHALRGNDMLSYSSSTENYSIADPFFSIWLNRPLDWLADLVTPDGKLPPLDDGNKVQMDHSSILRWNADYGYYGQLQNARKFTWINENGGGGLGSAIDLRLVELAMPRYPADQQIGPDPTVGNTSASETGQNGRQELIVRTSDAESQNHYVLLNGESGDAIVRGEGHEQPDQLQLLYYVDGMSYLMDRGYDNAAGLSNSTWNFYKAHNVMSYNYSHGGVPSPSVSLTKKRIVSDHQSVNELYRFSVGSISNGVTVLNGNITLELPAIATTGEYKRNVLIVHGNEPYVIDLNAIKTTVSNTSTYNNNIGSTGLFEQVMYHGNESATLYDPGNWFGWNFIRSGKSSKNLYLYLKPVEYDVNSYKTETVDSEEKDGNYAYLTRLILENSNNIPGYIGGSSYNNYFNTVGIMKVTDATLVNPQPIFAYDGNNKTPHQGWYWKHDASTVDVVVKRSKVNMTKYNQNLDFIIDENGIFIPGIRLPAGDDYGFTRFRKVNGAWEIDSNYQINITRQPNTFVYINGNSIGNKTFPSSSNIYVADNATVNITGDVTLQPGTTVYLGSDAELKVNTGGTILADGVTFRTISGSIASADRWNSIKLLTDYSQNTRGNSFKNCIFKGADKALYSAGYFTVVERSTFSNNHTAIYSTSDLIELRGVTIENGTYGIISRGSGAVKTNSIYNTSGFDRPSEISGENVAVRMYDYGSAYLHHTKFYVNSYHAYASEQGKLYAGKYEQDGSKGYNDFALAGTYDIYNSAVTSTGATWTAQANYNFWGSTSSAPSSSRFSGSVDRNFPLTCNPTTSGEYCEAQSSGGGDGGGGPCIIGSPGCPGDGPEPEAPPVIGLPLLTTSSGSSQASEPATSSTAASPPSWVVSAVNGLLAYIAKHPEDLRLYQLAQEAYHLLKAYDADRSLHEQVQFDQKLEQWMALYLKNKGVTGILSEELPDPALADARAPLLAHPEVLDRLGRAAVLLHIDDELNRGNYQGMQKLIDAWRPYIANDDDKASLLAAKAVAWEQTGEFGKALGAYEALEALKLTDRQAANYDAPDYSIIKAELADSMAARQQVKSEIAKVDIYTTAPEELPTEFNLLSPYPNPFNPSTVVSFTVPLRAQVAIKVYDMIGRRVAVLADQTYGPGTYQVRLNADRLASGVYFIRTEMNNKLFNQKVTLIK